MYHSVDVPPLFHGLRGLYVTPELLTRQLGELRAAAGVRFTTLSDWAGGHPVGREVAVTFDDAYQSLHRKALPVLQKVDVRAITYVVASLIGKTNEWDGGGGVRRESLMDEVQLREWIQSGHEIGSHGLTHRDLATLSRHEAHREIVESKQRLEDRFGQAIRHFCYPYGSHNESIRASVHEAGYETGVGTEAGINLPATDIFDLRRILARHRKPYLAALSRR